MQTAAQAYGNVARQIANPRELEANLLLNAAARFQAIREAWEDRKAELEDALLYNRKLWTIFLTSVTDGDNQLPANIRQNVANLGLFVMNETREVSGNPRPEPLTSLININRELAAGLLAST
jgi:flagellar protein FlaF